MQPGVSERIAALALEAKNAVDFLENICLAKKNIFENLRLSSGLKVDYKYLKDLPDYIQSRIVRLAIRHVRSDLTRLQRSHIEPIQKLIQARKSSGVLPLPGEAKVYVDRGSLYAFPGPLPKRPRNREKAQVVGPGVWLIHSNNLGASVEIRSKEPARVERLELRTRRPGDGVWESRHKLKEVFIEKKIPRVYRDFIPVLASGGKVVSVPGLIKNKDPKIEVSWKIETTSPLLDIEIKEQHS
jgi:tRNA(Ile)-lysidine synthase